MTEPPHGRDKVVQLPPVFSKSVIDKVVAAGEQLNVYEEAIKANQDVLARIARARYLAFIKAGFSEEQALTLCIKA